jgi:hypothetical protein
MAIDDAALASSGGHSFAEVMNESDQRLHIHLDFSACFCFECSDRILHY